MTVERGVDRHVRSLPMLVMALPPLAVFLGGSGPSQIPLSMLIVFVSAKLMAEVFERINQPGIVERFWRGS